MSHSGLLRRYLIFLAGVLCSALGISLITLAGMGTSAVSSLAYVLTYVFPGISLGTFTFVVNCVMLGGQILDLTGCTTEEMLYIVNNNMPVVGVVGDGSSVILIGYDQSYVTYIETATGNRTAISYEQMDSLLAGSGRTFISALE